MHFLKRGRKGKQRVMSIKLDMSKAYDRVEWDYLEQVLRVFNFPPRLTSLLMLWVRSATYSIMINGEPRSFIQPCRGLRQGDSNSLSPYLFLLCIEGLVSLVNVDAANSSLRGLTVCRGALEINHILFADNSLFFARLRNLFPKAAGNPKTIWVEFGAMY